MSIPCRLLLLGMIALPIRCALLVADEPNFAPQQDEASSDATAVSPADEELKLLAGDWVMVDKRRHGKSEDIHPYVWSADERGEVVTSGYQFRIPARWTTAHGWTWHVEPDASPKRIEIRYKEELTRGVYELKDDLLIVCLSLGDDALPSKVTPGSASRYIVYARGLDKGRKLLAERVSKQLEGAWSVNVAPRDAVAFQRGGTLEIKDGAFQFEKDGAARKYDFSLNPILEENVGAGPISVPHPTRRGELRKKAEKPLLPLHIDLLIAGTTYLGVYDFHGGFRFSYFPAKPEERPGKISADGSVTVYLTRVME